MRKGITFCVLLMSAVAFAEEGGTMDQRDRVNLLFIHHSCGGQLLADTGEKVGGTRETGERSIYVSHPNGGGLRTALESAGFQVNEASYGSVIGEDTDLCHWNRKFLDQMARVLTTARQDQLLPPGQTNRIVVFKSCYPNLKIDSAGSEPGAPDSCERTLANAKAAYRALLPSLAKHPEVLFVALTPPALTKPAPVGVKAKIKALFEGEPKWGELGREFTTWMTDHQQGWLAGYEGRNIAVFDYYDILTGSGESDWSAYPAKEGIDSHPSAEGNRLAAEAFAPFLMKAWQDHRQVLNKPDEVSSH